MTVLVLVCVLCVCVMMCLCEILCVCVAVAVCGGWPGREKELGLMAVAKNQSYK